MANHGPNCAHCQSWRDLADKVITDDYYHCKVCQGWGWVIGCPGCRRLWGNFWPPKKRKKKKK